MVSRNPLVWATADVTKNSSKKNKLEVWKKVTNKQQAQKQPYKSV